MAHWLRSTVIATGAAIVLAMLFFLFNNQTMLAIIINPSFVNIHVLSKSKVCLKDNNYANQSKNQKRGRVIFH
jgi:hypothetical protein